jgi:hypothetical protein
LLDIDNPTWSVIANIVSATTNVPLDRLIKKIDNVDAAITEDITAMQRFALLMGWNTWDLGVEDSDIIAIENEIKEKKKTEKKDKKLSPEKTVKKKSREVLDLKKNEQVKIIKDLKLDPKDYPKEQDRVDVIMEHYDKDPEKIDSMLTVIKSSEPSKNQKRSKELFKMKKKDQVDILIDFGLSPKQIRELKYEEDRVNKIIELENKKKSK